MENTQSSSFLKKLLAGIVILIVAVIVIQFAVGLFAGLISTLFWIVVAVVLIGAVLWALNALL